MVMESFTKCRSHTSFRFHSGFNLYETLHYNCWAFTSFCGLRNADVVRVVSGGLGDGGAVGAGMDQLCDFRFALSAHGQVLVQVVSTECFAELLEGGAGYGRLEAPLI